MNSTRAITGCSARLTPWRQTLAALDAETAGSAETGNARAAIGLAEGDPVAALAAVRDVLTGKAPAAHTALLAEILDVLRGSSIAPGHEPWLAEIGQPSPSELRVLRYLPTNLSRPEIASELSVGLNNQAANRTPRASLPKHNHQD